MLRSILDSFKEGAELDRLYSSEYKDARRLVFYAESGIYYRYYEDYIEHILANSEFDICYWTSDSKDPILQNHPPRIKPFYLKNSFPMALSRLDAKVLVIATPDLGTATVQRGPAGVHHVYAFRGICSTHLAYKLGAFDHYDSLLCVAQYQIDEVRKTEELYGLRAKELILTGYPLVERIYRDHARWTRPDGPPLCLVAPTWGPSSILETCIMELLESLARSDFSVVLRAHPEFMKRCPQKLQAIGKVAAKARNITLQADVTSMQVMHDADLLVTDHSSISVDYFIGTQRPVLFIDTPTRIDNPEHEKLGMQPVELVYRNPLGRCLPPDRMADVNTVLQDLLDRRSEYVESVPAIRDALVANWQKAAQVGGDFILSLLNR